MFSTILPTMCQILVVTQLNLIVCVCVSGHMSPHCSAHEEWLIMKLCTYVRYHTANNVSNFGGDPIKFNCVCVCVCVCVSGDMSPYCSAHEEWLIMKLCMYVRYHTANNVSNFGGERRHIARHMKNG